MNLNYGFCFFFINKQISSFDQSIRISTTSKMYKRSIVTLIVLSLAILSVEPWRSFNVIFDNVTVTYNKNWATVEFDLKTLAEDTVFDVLINVRKTIDSAWVHGYLRFDSKADIDNDEIIHVEVINKTANICQIFEMKKTVPVIRLSIEELAKYGIIFQSCPIEKTQYHLQNFKVDEELMPPYLPETDFFARLHVFRNNTGKIDNIWDIQLHGHIDKSKGFDKLRLLFNNG